jgi:hypothetical protein
MTRSQPMSQQSWFPPYIRHYGSNNCCLHPFQLFQQLRLSQYSRRPGTARRFQRSHSQPTTREFGNRNQERRHRQEGHSCSSRITKNTGTAQGDSNRGRCVRTGAVPKFTSYGRGLSPHLEAFASTMLICQQIQPGRRSLGGRPTPFRLYKFNSPNGVRFPIGFS